MEAPGGGVERARGRSQSRRVRRRSTAFTATITVEALFVSSTAWIEKNEGAYDKVLRAFTAAGPAIKALAKPAN